MEYFLECEIIVLIVLAAMYILLIPVHIMTVHLRRFGPLRDLQPILCLLTQVGGMIFNAHLFFAWHHDIQLCSVLAILQFLAGAMFFCSFLAKHYVLHRRYAAVAAAPLPTWIVWILSAFPFVILATYRIAARTSGHCPNIDGFVALIGGLIVLGTVVKFVLKEHPSSHYRRAVVIEVVCMFAAAGTSVTRQYTDGNAIMIACNIVLGITVNAAYLAYVIPPIMLRLRKGSEYDDEQERMLNDSMATGLMMESCDVDRSIVHRIICSLSRAIRSNNGVSDRSNTSAPEGMHSAGNSKHMFAGTANSYGTGEGNSHTLRNSPSGPSGALSHSHGSGGRLGQGGNSVTFREREVDREVTTIIEMIKEDDLDRLEKFVTRCGFGVVNSPDHVGRTPLHHAVRHGNHNIIRFLIEIGGDANHFDERGHSPLHETVRRKDHKDRSSAITELVRGGAMVNLPSQDGLVPLHFAVMHGHLGALNTLLRYDASPMFHHDKEERHQPWDHVHVTNCQNVSDRNRKSPLMLAVEMNEEMMLSSMIYALKQRAEKSKTQANVAGVKLGSCNFNADLRCPHGMTLLHVALALGNSKVVSVLLNEAGCSVRALYEETSQNVFHLAAMGDNGECVSLLLSHMDAPDIMPAPAGRLFGSGELVTPPLHTPTTTGTGCSFRVGGSGSMGSQGGTDIGSSSRGLHMRGITQYGMMTHGATGSMGFGQAFSKLREYVPSASTDHSRLTEMEATVDQVTQKLRQKGHHKEVETLHKAMNIVMKRIRMNSSRSLSNLYNSAGSLQVVHSQGAADAKPMDRIREMLNQVDGARCTPLHYAIQHGNIELVTLFCAYGAVFVDVEDTMSSQDSSRNAFSSSEHGTDILADDLDLSEAALQRQRSAVESVPSAPQTSGSSTSGSGTVNSFPKPRCSSHSRFILKNVDTDSQRLSVHTAVKEGQQIFASYHSVSSVSNNTFSVDDTSSNFKPELEA